nr:rane fusion protein multidrug efflux system [Candidatus Cloacimonadota bacterium]
MNRKILFLIPVAILLLALSACGEKAEEAKSMDQLQQELGIPVRVQKVKKTDFQQSLRYNATLGGISESTAQAMLADVITKVHYKVGDMVEKDDVVVEFPTNSPSAQYEQARTAYQSLQATRERMRRLYEEGAISLQDFENVDTQLKVAKANLEASEQMIKVRAPISGIITNIMVTESERSFPGQDLFTVASPDGYKATIMVPESDINSIRPNSRVTAEWNGISISGKISMIARAMDPATKAFRVEATFPGYKKDLNYGVTAEISILIKEQRGVFLAQRHQIIRENGDAYLWLAVDDTAKKVPIKTGLSDQLNYVITEGLSEGDLMIIEGLKSVKEDAKIRIIED